MNERDEDYVPTPQRVIERRRVFRLRYRITKRTRPDSEPVYITGLKESEVGVIVISENAYFKMEVIYTTWKNYEGSNHRPGLKTQ